MNLMIGLDGYTISSGIFPAYLQGREIISVPLAEKGRMHIGYRADFEGAVASNDAAPLL